MKKKYIKISTIFFVFIFITGCRADRLPKLLDTVKLEKEKFKINKINFYFENSLSMNGYLKGEDFRHSMAEIIYNFKGDSIHNYFVNTKVHKTDSMLDKIRKGNISVGNTGNSDHKFIFTNAIKNAAGNNLSIVVTDGIYSMSSGGLTLGDVEKDIEKAFENALKQNELETVVLKMASNFTGRYYSESCPIKGGVKIDQERPYYILLFGNKEVIDKALEEIVVLEDLNGFKEQARFFITKEIKVDYSILLNGKDKKGSFKPSDRKNKIIKSIDLEERYEPRNSDISKAYLQFAVGVNFTNLSIPKDYLLDTENYTISDNTDYEVLEIKDLRNLDQATKNDIKSRDKDFSHIIILKGKTKLYGDLKIQLDIKVPSWIKKTGTANDCAIQNDTTKTFSFDKLMLGINKAYEKINKKNEYFNLIIKINP
ncbi:MULTISPECIES: hypothetical protein [unclassified Polaribacter]|uniref:hypothetical protein n=1 Tax=unclassified Polaribacter TaxID=196858 RepID=UPI0011BEF9A4|nr:MULTISPECIES: hypothetical protein [unclassified Polaribacter]TXD53113.1 hypothetical protein ES043_05305 [Polaribacter sp. IC063]TXD61233.1 hypothetical protein ES044_05275 [Polaribacter sp. IC066]